MRTFCLLTLIAWQLGAQETVAPTTGVTVGSARGENAGSYNVVQSWEFGYRFATVGGDVGQYKADVNYGNGVRLLGSNLTINSKDGKAHWFDEVVLTTQGLGNDPYESVALRVRKNKLYEYSFGWHLNDYYNPGLVTAGGYHFQDTRRKWQDHDLTLFPGGKYKLMLGYSGNVETGPALSSQQFFDTRADALPVFVNVRRNFNEFRLGGEINVAKFRLTVMRRWEFYKEDSPESLTTPESSNDPNNPATLQSFAKSEPQRGYTPGWLVNLFTERSWFSANGRFTYNGGQQNFVLDESAVGLDRFGANANRFVFVSGNARRPVTTADGTVSFFLTKKLTLVDNSSFSNTRISGDNFFEEYDLATLSNQTLDFQFLGIRLFTISMDLRYQFTPRFSIYTGYQYSDRLVRSNESFGAPGEPYDAIIAQQSNHQNVGNAGFNWLIWKALRLHAEGEIGRNDMPFYPIALKNYHDINVRLEYRVKKLQLATGYKETYNNNSISLTAYSSHARNFTSSATWTFRPWLSLDASYSHLHLDTAGGINFFAGSPRAIEITGEQSIYLSNIHAGTLGIRFSVGKRVDLYAGYSITKDVGDGRSTATGSVNPTTDPAGAVFAAVQTFPLTFQSPIARVSVKLREKVRFNVGYQYYGYKEEFGLYGVNENYRANTGYTSLLWSF
jgi:hypothetical protein